MQLSVFDVLQRQGSPKIEIEDLFEAYLQCRRNKRGTMNAVAFEVDYEALLVVLCEEINEGTYHPGKSLAFTISKPVKREIFAADFKDRVVHHLIFNKLNPLFETSFIYDSYACRAGKGTKLGVQRLDRFIRKCSRNYSRDCYVLKLDIRGFFMHVDKKLLYEDLKKFAHEKYLRADRDLVLDLCRKLLENDPTANCIMKGSRSDWNDLPLDKSLFCAPPHTGMPIGNLTSQVFANFYLNCFDHLMKCNLHLRFYGRYVDDFVIVHESRDYLRSLISVISEILRDQFKLTLHPKKIYLQHYAKGVQFLGCFFKPHRLYVSRRNKGNFYAAIARQNAVAEQRTPTKEDRSAFFSSLKSYLGFFKHRKTYRLRQKMASLVSPAWWRYASLNGNFTKVTERTPRR